MESKFDRFYPFFMLFLNKFNKVAQFIERKYFSTFIERSIINIDAIEIINRSVV